MKALITGASSGLGREMAIVLSERGYDIIAVARQKDRLITLQEAYVLRLSQALSEELRHEKSKVRISVLCPGPVKTEFESAANMSFGNGNEPGRKFIIADKRKVSEYAISRMLKGKHIIIPGKLMKIAVFFRRIFSEKMMCKLLYRVQSKKIIQNKNSQ